MKEDNNRSFAEMRELIKKGLELSFKKLLENKRKNGGTLVISVDGKIQKIKAADLSL